MKFITIKVLIAFAFLPVFSQQAVSVSGKIFNPKDNKVHLKYYNDFLSFEEITANSAILDGDGSFRIRVTWNKAYPAQFYHGNELISLYLNPGDHLQIQFDGNKSAASLTFSGNGSEINQYIAKKSREIPVVNLFSIGGMKEREFTRLVDSLHQKELMYFKNYFDNIPAKNAAMKSFMELESAQIQYSWMANKKNYPIAHAILQQSKNLPELSPDYYEFMKQASLRDDKAMQSRAYLNFLESYINGELAELRKKDTLLNVNQYKDEFIVKNFSGQQRDYLLAKWAYYLMTEAEDPLNGERVKDQYTKHSPDKKYLGVLDKAWSKLMHLAPGSLAPDFTLSDLNGKKVSLHDFKGKIVYLDFWASWCGPCRAEIPYAKKLEEQFHGKDVVFLCVSIDQNPDSWRKAITDNDIKGVHLIVTPDSNVPHAYNIKGIPRYVIIDKEGKIVDKNAKRPSGEVWRDLEKLLE